MIGPRAFAFCASLRKVIAKPTLPPFANNTVFMNAASDIVAYVPKASLSDYAGWAGLSDIRPMDDNSGIDEINTNESDVIEIYNVNGVKVNKNIDSLTPGIYLMRTNQGVTKHIIR